MAGNWRNRLNALRNKLASHEPGSSGTRSVERRPERTPINLGIDFGTRLTKVCYRDLTRDVSGIVDFSIGTPDWHNSLLSSAVVVTESGDIVVGLDERIREAAKAGGTLMEHLKIRLAILDLAEDLASFHLHQPDLIESEKTFEAICAAYLANVIARSKQWILENLGDELAGQEPRWSANVGVPVRIHGSPAIDRFRRVLRVAWHMTELGETSYFNVANAVRAHREVIDGVAAGEVDCHAFPETAAAVQSFLVSPSAREGLYLYFDVGGGTLDGVSFRYTRPEGVPNVNFFGAGIEPLGVDAILSRKPEDERDQILTDLFADPPPSALDNALEEENTAIRRLVSEVVLAAKQKDHTDWQREMAREDIHVHWRTGEPRRERHSLLIFFGGGGSDSPWYQTAALSTYVRHQHANSGIPEYRLAYMPSPGDLSFGDVPAQEFHRFAVAYGLSIPYGEGPEFKIPSEVKNLPPPQRKEITPPPYSGR